MRGVAEASAGRVRELEDRRYTALRDGDHLALDSILHEQLVYVHSAGVIERKPAFVSKVRSGYYSYLEMEHHVEEIVLAEKTAIIVESVRGAVLVDGRLLHLAARSLVTWCLAGSDWRMLSYQPIGVLGAKR